MKPILFAIAALAVLAPAPRARADVTARSDAGFVVKVGADTRAGQAETWRTLTDPARWWSRDHTWSKNSANLSLDPRAGGCFCETLPASGRQRAGSVEHMRVIHADPAKGILRLQGALGPMQGEALTGTLTVTLSAAGSGTHIDFEYVIGGYMRFRTGDIAPAVDGVLKQQAASLARVAEGAPKPG